MAEHQIPAFGDWETTGNTPYTQKFEDVRKHKSMGVSAHPNDHKRAPEAGRKPSPHASYNTADPRDQKPKNPPHVRRPETGASRPTESPLHQEAAPRRPGHPAHQQYREQGSNRSPYRTTGGATSPLQPTHHSKSKPRGGTHTPERKSLSEGHGTNMPGRNRRKQAGRSYEPPEDEVTVPPFGEWDETNAASGDKFTGIFNKLRDDKLSPNASVNQSASANRGQDPKVRQTCPCCIL